MLILNPTSAKCWVSPLFINSVFLRLVSMCKEFCLVDKGGLYQLAKGVKGKMEFGELSQSWKGSFEQRFNFVSFA